MSNYKEDNIFKALYPQLVQRKNQNIGDGVIPNPYKLNREPTVIFDTISEWLAYVSNPSNEELESVNLWECLRKRFLSYETDFLSTLIYLTAKYKGLITEKQNLFWLIGLQRVGNAEYSKDEYISLVEKELFAEINPNMPQIEMNWREQLDKLEGVQAKKDYLHNYIINTKQMLSNDILEMMELELRRLERMPERKSQDGLQASSPFHTEKAKVLITKVIEAGLAERTIDGLKWKETKQLLAYLAEKASAYLSLSSKHDKDGNLTTAWKPFENLFNMKGLKGAKQNWMRLNTKFEPTGYKKVDALF